MKKSEQKQLFDESYLSTLQIKVKLADTQTLICELGRGSGKTTHIMAGRLDRVQNSMPGALLTLGAATYKDIFSNILPGLLKYFDENYERGIYFEIGKEPPRHFKRCHTLVLEWSHTISFCNGCVVKFISADRPESTLGLSTPHGLFDELLKIKEEFIQERFIPALRADRSKYGHSPYFMGWSAFTSTPNFDTDENWFIDLEKDIDKELINLIIEIAFEVDQRIYELEIAKKSLDFNNIAKLEKFIARWTARLTELRRQQIYYVRASSFSNIRILGIDYIENQIKSTKDKSRLNSSVFAIRNLGVKDKFFGKFGKQHLFEDGYSYDFIDKTSANEDFEESCSYLKHYNRKQPLIAGYDAGPFSSIVFAQKNAQKKEFRVLKDMWVYHPDQQDVLAQKIDDFFQGGEKTIHIHYDRAANQKDAEWKKYYPSYKELGVNDTDATLLKDELTRLGWRVFLLSTNQQTIHYSKHYRLLNMLFGKPDRRADKILIDKNECEALVSSINHSPLKRHEGRVMLDKSSEKLPFEEQALNSTQIASALMYLLWGEYHQLLPDSDQTDATPIGTGTYMM